MLRFTNSERNGQGNRLPKWKRQDCKYFPILTDMAKQSKAGEFLEPGKLFLEERMAVRGIDVTALAVAIDKPYATVWRYVEGQRRPHKSTLPKLAAALNCSVPQLYKHPDTDTAEEVFAGLDPETIRDIRSQIDFRRWKATKK